METVAGRGVGDGSEIAPDELETRSLHREQVLEITTVNDATYEARVQDVSAALAAARQSIASERFVQIGDTIVRSEDIRTIRVGGEEPSAGERIRSFIQGGKSMTTYEDERSHEGKRYASGSRKDRGWTDGVGERGLERPRMTELIALLLGVLAIAICTAVFDDLGVWRGLVLVTALTGAYILSRGLAKAGAGPERRRGGL